MWLNHISAILFFLIRAFKPCTFHIITDKCYFKFVVYLSHFCYPFTFFPSIDSIQLELSTANWHLPFTSIKITSCAVAAANCQHPLDRSSRWRAEMRHFVLCKNCQNTSLDSLIPSGADFMSQILVSPHIWKNH